MLFSHHIHTKQIWNTGVNSNMLGSFQMFCYCYLGNTPGSVQVILLALYAWITHRGLRGPYGNPEIKTRYAKKCLILNTISLGLLSNFKRAYGNCNSFHH